MSRSVGGASFAVTVLSSDCKHLTGDEGLQPSSPIRLGFDRRETALVHRVLGEGELDVISASSVTRRRLGSTLCNIFAQLVVYAACVFGRIGSARWTSIAVAPQKVLRRWRAILARTASPIMGLLALGVGPLPPVCVAAVPAVPSLTSPANGVSLVSGTTSVNLVWGAVNGAATYNLQVGSSCGSTSVAGPAVVGGTPFRAIGLCA